MSGSPELAQELRRELSDADVRLILGQFAIELRDLTAALRHQDEAGDAAGFRRTAHAIAGAAGAVGAAALAATARAAMKGDAAAGFPSIEALAASALSDTAKVVADLRG